MNLVLPTSGASLPLETGRLAKGQLYNLDLDEWLDLQFNPETFDYDRVFNYAQIAPKGTERGGDLQYLSSGPISFDLDLVFVADPSAPEIKYQAEERLSNNSVRVDFEQLETMLNRWQEPLANKGRPSRIAVIIGPRRTDGVITSLTITVREFFREDLSAREAEITIGFREWQMRQSA